MRCTPLQITEETSSLVNTVHLVIIAVEGVVLVLAAACYTWYLSETVRQKTEHFGAPLGAPGPLKLCTALS